MNPRVKALLVQAIREVGPDDVDRGGKEKTLQRFAELVVEECTNIIEDRYHDSGDESDVVLRSVLREIEQRFG